MTENTANTQADYFIDITNDVCPMTFVRTKLLIESMQPGQTAEVRLQHGEPLQNVPKSVREIGHEIVSLEPEDPSGLADGVHRLVIRTKT